MHSSFKPFFLGVNFCIYRVEVIYALGDLHLIVFSARSLVASSAGVLIRVVQMFGRKVFLTYKRKRQSRSSSFIQGNCCQTSVCEEACDCSLSTPVKHDQQTAEKASEKDEEKPMVRFQHNFLFLFFICLWIIRHVSVPPLQFHICRNLSIPLLL